MIVSRLFSRSAQLKNAAGNSPALKSGARGEGVALFQAALIRCGHEMRLTTRHHTAYPDGIFGKETEDGTRQFQKNNALVADGIAGRNTMRALDAVVARAEAELHDDNPLQRHPRTYKPVNRPAGET